MATIRRLSDHDVRAIFESLHGNHPPPSHLHFKIVPVGPNGLKLSPPSYEFQDGLYVLLRPEEKRKGNSSSTRATVGGVAANATSKVPAHLIHHLIPEVPPETCPWSLSGPQFPTPTAIQQRYCYPKGDPVYSSRKGGALWTMYDVNKKEDLEFRLLHVYFSAKRAVNKGINIPEDEIKAAAEASNKTVGLPPNYSPSSSKKGSSNKRSKKKGAFSSGNRGIIQKHHRYPQQHPRQHYDASSPMSRNSTATTLTTPSSRSSVCASPLSFEILPLPSSSPRNNRNTVRDGKNSIKDRHSINSSRNRNNNIFVSPATTATPPQPMIPHPFSNVYHGSHEQMQQHHHHHHIFHQDGLLGQTFHPVLSFENNSHDGTSSSGSGNHDQASPFRHPPRGHASNATAAKSSSSIFKSNDRSATERRHDGSGDGQGNGGHEEAFSCDMDDSFHADLDSYWNDPLFALVMKPSVDHGNHFHHGSGGSSSNNVDNMMDNHQHHHINSHHGLPPHPMDPMAFSGRLQVLHQRLRDMILSSPHADQGPLLSIFASWARCISKSPLSDLPRMPPGVATASDSLKTNDRTRGPASGDIMEDGDSVQMSATETMAV